jgi:hypothetical protein
MATEKQIAANRRNAAKSTGPRTEQGKARAKMNAFRHGFAAPAWSRATEIEAFSLGPDRESFDDTYMKFMARRFEIDREKASLLTQVDKLLASSETRDVAGLLKRAAALDRYDRQIAAHVRRLFKQAQRLTQQIHNARPDDRFK